VGEWGLVGGGGGGLGGGLWGGVVRVGGGGQARVGDAFGGGVGGEVVWRGVHLRGGGGWWVGGGVRRGGWGRRGFGWCGLWSFVLLGCVVLICFFFVCAGGLAVPCPIKRCACVVGIDHLWFCLLFRFGRLSISLPNLIKYSALCALEFCHEVG